jgi:hypothetical protein
LLIDLSVSDAKYTAKKKPIGGNTLKIPYNKRLLPFRRARKTLKIMIGIDIINKGIKGDAAAGCSIFPPNDTYDIIFPTLTVHYQAYHLQI